MKQISFYVLTLLAGILLPARSQAHWENGGWGMMPGMHNWGMGWLGMLFGILFWILIVVGLVYVIKFLIQTTSRHGEAPEEKNQTSTALDILKERYARGEIDKTEFEAKKKDLTE